MSKIYATFLAALLIINSSLSMEIEGTSLPDEVVNHVLSFLDPPDLAHLSQLNKQWHTYIQDEDVWKAFYGREFNTSDSPELPQTWKGLYIERKLKLPLPVSVIVNLMPRRLLIGETDPVATIKVDFPKGLSCQVSLLPKGEDLKLVSNLADYQLKGVPFSEQPEVYTFTIKNFFRLPPLPLKDPISFTIFQEIHGPKAFAKISQNKLLELNGSPLKTITVDCPLYNHGWKPYIRRIILGYQKGRSAKLGRDEHYQSEIIYPN
jgi:hypothetical protein